MSTYNGMLSDIPDDIVERLLDCQFEQIGVRNPRVFEMNISAARSTGGMDWNMTTEGSRFWSALLINNHDFSLFYELYPRVNGEVYIAPVRRKKELIGYKAKNIDYLIAADAVVKNVRADGYKGVMNSPVHIQICHDIVIDKLKGIGLLNILFVEVYDYV